MARNQITLDQALDTVMQLPVEEQEILLEIFRRRRIEARRREIAQDARESIRAFREGKLKAQSADQVIEELNRAIEEIE